MSESGKEKVIEYGPARKGGNKGLFIAILIAFSVTWAIMLFSIFHLNKELSKAREDVPSYQIDQNVIAKIDEVKRELSNIKNIEKTPAYQEEVKTRTPVDIPKTLVENPSPVGKVDLSAILRRLDKLEEKSYNENLPQLDGALSPLVLSLLNLKDKIEKREDYNADLEVVKKLSKGDTEIEKNIAKLEGFLKKGVVSFDEVKRDFALIAGDVVEESKNQDKKGIFGGISYAVSKMIKIRKTGEVEGETVEAIVARAENNLKYGNVKNALVQVDKLDGKPAEIAQPWKEKARRFINIEKIFVDIYERITKVSVAIRENAGTPFATLNKHKKELERAVIFSTNPEGSI